MVEPGLIYADYIELRIRELVKEDRARRGLTATSPELDELAAQVRREPAWPEIVALVGSVVLFVLVRVLG